MHVDVSNQVALVTGAAHRVGKAIALELARNGVHILVHYNSSPEAATETVREIKSLGVDAFSVQADIGTPTGVEAIFAALEEHFGRLNILVNSASVFQQRDLLEVSLEDWQQTLNVNLTGPFLCTQAAVEVMRQNDPSGGAIINICDKGAIMPWPKYPHHSVSKAGLLMLTKVSAASLGPDIRVNAIIPGPVMKPAGTNMSDKEWTAIGKRLPLQRTGAVIEVDGGEHLC